MLFTFEILKNPFIMQIFTIITTTSIVMETKKI